MYFKIEIGSWPPAPLSIYRLDAVAVDRTIFCETL